MRKSCRKASIFRDITTARRSRNQGGGGGQDGRPTMARRRREAGVQAATGRDAPHRGGGNGLRFTEAQLHRYGRRSGSSLPPGDGRASDFRRGQRPALHRSAATRARRPRHYGGSTAHRAAVTPERTSQRLRWGQRPALHRSAATPERTRRPRMRFAATTGGRR